MLTYQVCGEFWCFTICLNQLERTFDRGKAQEKSSAVNRQIIQF